MIGMTEDRNIGMEVFEGMLGMTRGYCQEWRNQRILGFQALLEPAVAGRLVRTKAEVEGEMASIWGDSGIETYATVLE